MTYETVLLPKWLSHQRRILAEEQFRNSYTFSAMPILIFSPVQMIMTHPLHWRLLNFWKLYINQSVKADADVGHWFKLWKFFNLLLYVAWVSQPLQPSWILNSEFFLKRLLEAFVATKPPLPSLLLRSKCIFLI